MKTIFKNGFHKYFKTEIISLYISILFQIVVVVRHADAGDQDSRVVVTVTVPEYGSGSVPTKMFQIGLRMQARI
jgi:hypothetical protein